jgi:N-acetylglutamate synthase-like GNAT family acetyltransferase
MEDAATFEIEPATTDDLPRVQALLGACGLPSADLRAADLAGFFVCRGAGARVVGSVGIQMLGDAGAGLGLLRSLAVVPELRGRRVAHELWARGRAEARRRGARQLYLLTTTAEALFARWGFRRVDRDAAPAPVRDSAEFASLCPSSAVVMSLDLAADAA